MTKVMLFKTPSSFYELTLSILEEYMRVSGKKLYFYDITFAGNLSYNADNSSEDAISVRRSIKSIGMYDANIDITLTDFGKRVKGFIAKEALFNIDAYRTDADMIQAVENLKERNPRVFRDIEIVEISNGTYSIHNVVTDADGCEYVRGERVERIKD